MVKVTKKYQSTGRLQCTVNCNNVIWVERSKVKSQWLKISTVKLLK